MRWATPQVQGALSGDSLTRLTRNGAGAYKSASSRRRFVSCAEMFHLARPDTVRVGFDENGIASDLTVVEDGKAVIGATRLPDAGARKATRSWTGDHS
jgi:hypothetical protein